MGLWDKITGITERAGNFLTGGMNDRKRSERIVCYAKEQEEAAIARLEAVRVQTNECLSDLMALRVQVFATTVKEFVDLFEKVGDVNKTDLGEIDHELQFNLSLSEVKDLKIASQHVQDMLVGGSAGALGGATLAAGAWGLAGVVGTASTGTAIGTLSGAAATNATLAWLGGGAASAGGAGIAGGMVVLGGLALIPAAGMAMYFGQNKAKQKLNDARDFQDQVDAHQAQIETEMSQLERICEGAELMKEVISSLQAVVQHQNKIMRAKLTDVAKATHLLHTRLKTPLLGDDGLVNDGALSVLEQSISQLHHAST